jgi:hypothetical protein
MMVAVIFMPIADCQIRKLKYTRRESAIDKWKGEHCAVEFGV